jgi:hypothetical protein
MEKCTAWKAYAARMYREREEPLDTPLGPWLGETKNLPDEFGIVTEGPCLVENLDVRASNVRLLVKISEDMVKAKDSRGLVMVSKIICSSDSH